MRAQRYCLVEAPCLRRHGGCVVLVTRLQSRLPHSSKTVFLNCFRRGRNVQARTDQAMVPCTIQPRNTAERWKNRMSGSTGDGETLRLFLLASCLLFYFSAPSTELGRASFAPFFPLTLFISLNRFMSPSPAMAASSNFLLSPSQAQLCSR